MSTLLFSLQGVSSPASAYMDSKAPINDRIEDLLKQMTLAEKIGQMTQIDIAAITTASGIDPTGEKKKTVELDEAKFIPLIRDFAVGNFVNGDAVTPEQWTSYITRIQSLNLQYSRLGIPVIYGMDHIHGANNVVGATMFPQSINMAATFNPEYTRDEALAIASECSQLGHNWIYSPVLGLGRNPNWPRFFETYGEDPYLTSILADTYVKTLQNNDLSLPYRQAACAKHYLGYSDPRSGWDRTPAIIPDQHLYEFFLPPFKAAIDAGVKTIMINSGDINGIPVHGSHRILTTLLREELGFDGVAMTDWQDVERLHIWHKVAPSFKEAVFMAVTAGIDVSLTPHDPKFAVVLKELVEEGRIPESRIDTSVRRVLKLKFDLGLFDENRFPDGHEVSAAQKAKNQENSLNAARESIVLMKNEGILPIQKQQKVLVVGDFAKTKRALCGGWTYVWFAKDDGVFPPEMSTLHDAIIQEFGKAQVLFTDMSDFDEKSGKADVIVLALSNEPYAELLGNRTDLSLEPKQSALAQKVRASGIPYVTVVMEGRPILLADVYDDCDAFIWAGLPGYYGGQAIAEVLSGKVNPSGKLPFSYPAYPLHFSPYNRKWMDTLVYHESLNERISLADFGSGLSYSEFGYRELKLNRTVLHAGETLTASVTVENVSKLEGKETVLWFLTDEYASITRPLKELRHFEKQSLKPGGSAVFEFEIHPEEDLTFPDENGRQMLEPGKFNLSVGPLSAEFELVAD